MESPETCQANLLAALSAAVEDGGNAAASSADRDVATEAEADEDGFGQFTIPDAPPAEEEPTVHAFTLPAVRAHLPAAFPYMPDCSSSCADWRAVEVGEALDRVRLLRDEIDSAVGRIAAIMELAADTHIAHTTLARRIRRAVEGGDE